MEFREHLIASTIFFIILWIVFEKVTFSLILIPIILCRVPDYDQSFKRLHHRNILTHSIIIPLFVFIFNPNLHVLLMVLSFGFHDLCDIKLRRKDGKFVKIGGTYTVKWSKKGLGYTNTIIFLMSNFIVSFVLFLAFVL